MELNKYHLLVTKYLSEEISEEEKLELNHWINSNDDNKSFFENKKLLWELSDIDEDYVPDLKKGLIDLEQKLKTHKKPSFNHYFLRVAAAVVILISVSIFSYNYFNHDGELIEIMANNMEIITLPDGSKVWLNSGSSISYKEDFSERTVNLDGEAFFDVETKPNSKFKVKIDKNWVEVLGTSFHIKEEKTKLDVSVLTGKVLLKNPKMRQILTAEETASTNFENHAITKLENAGKNSMDWRNINLFFNNQNLEEILENISQYYGVTIKLKNKTLANCRFSGNLKNKSLANIFELLKVSINLEIEERPNHVFVLNGSNCG